MCIFLRFRFLCGCQKLKITMECEEASTNAQNLRFCPEDPRAHIDDGRPDREYEDSTAYGPGVCSSVRCRWQWGLLPFGMFHEDVKRMFGKNIQLTVDEDDGAFDMSEQFRIEREKRWLELLTPEQREQVHKTTVTIMNPAPALAHVYREETYQNGFSIASSLDETNRVPAQLHLSEAYPTGFSVWLSPRFGDSVEKWPWWALNPRYLSAQQLQQATGTILPAEITIPGSTMGQSTPHKPLTGPFQVSNHFCKPIPGICVKCGRFKGSQKQAKKQEKIEAENEASARESRLLGKQIY